MSTPDDEPVPVLPGQLDLDHLLGAAIIPSLTVWTVWPGEPICGWCLKWGGFSGIARTQTSDGTRIMTQVCEPCAGKHGINAHLDAIRANRINIKH